MTAPSAAYASFEEKWLAEYPENAFVALFLPAGLRLRASAFGTLIHELTHAAVRVGEAQVAAAKLAWWQQELAEATSGRPRHPVTQVLFAESGAGPAQRWTALAATALQLLDDAPAPSADALIERLRPFHAAVDAAEAALFAHPAVSAGARVRQRTVSHLLHELAGNTQRLPVPLDLLARHGIGRADLGTTSAARSALVRDFIQALAAHSPGDAAGGTLAQRVRARLDAALMCGALAAGDPLAYLRARTPSTRWQALWITWREARAVAAGR